MALLTRKSGNDLARLHRDMDDLFGAFFGNWPTAQFEKTVWPAIDVAEDENQITVKAEVPGCNADDIDISVHGNVLTVSGEKKYEEEKKEKGYYHIERSYGSFSRQINMPAEVEQNKIDAAYKNGVLTITLPKAEKAKPVKIKVKGQ
ncbi:MAG: Hsp20/alpha crystallin family protein [Phycisphaerae bacterium]